MYFIAGDCRVHIIHAVTISQVSGRSVYNIIGLERFVAVFRTRTRTSGLRGGVFRHTVAVHCTSTPPPQQRHAVVGTVLGFFGLAAGRRRLHHYETVVYRVASRGQVLTANAQRPAQKGE